jgi:hypothetical protein
VRERRNWSDGPLGTPWVFFGLFFGIGIAAVFGYWPALAVVSLVVLLTRRFRRLNHHDRRTAAKPAEDVLAIDKRAPVLLLRSFEDDGKEILGGRTTWEELILEGLGRIGPVVAMGRPGEPLPEAGAARTYSTEGEWRDRIRNLASDASVVAVVLGSTGGVLEDLELIDELRLWRKVIFLVPPLQKRDLEIRHRVVATRLAKSGLGFSAAAGDSVLLAWSEARTGF